MWLNSSYALFYIITKYSFHVSKGPQIDGPGLAPLVPRPRIGYVYVLHTNEWLFGSYGERQLWVTTIVKDTFWARMSTTQRSEIMHAFFDGYVNSKTTLKQFVEYYENALRDKVDKESHAHFNSHIPYMTHYPMERQFQETYTTEKFKDFQQELSVNLYCEVSLNKDNFPCSEFTVGESVMVGNMIVTALFTVWFKEVDFQINCNCRLFEFNGILCQHVIAVLIHKKIFFALDKYILRRWRKDVVRGHAKVKIGYDNWSTKPEGQ
ncbi:hypothetical protein Ddye_004973 [Dipteronia dyeriana]|uniref:Protein FAR1-RELATED SEQUENCE n=1 Tax=Dipteronia dyeriana TaxID=168575 RepID=A0AAD9XF91_9ROSI|nr:hypothetical protein Ddye_004973 [Dipteronia dyeriana]